ncbi:RNA-directed DNA polymerase from mobile element jockey [Amphibalanus amphitrite]|uniref:RNA-directed DNA polymerase from mobile element jockey n=1 Tax=Amphibalanus amphitrite TaxID=1232801 RepID=A0A6A4W2D5_AMPAM|nr:RNA-directed DNA polymerase from mobile element jockey [Amphibalanus amphitrite]
MERPAYTDADRNNFGPGPVHGHTGASAPLTDSDGLTSTDPPRESHGNAGGRSTPDLTLVSGDLAGGAEWETGPGLGSDHLPIYLTLPTINQRPKRKGPGRFRQKKADWEAFRRHLDTEISKWPSHDAPLHQQESRLTGAIITAAKRSIPFGNGGGGKPPFWNESCQKAVDLREGAQSRASTPDHTADDITAAREARQNATNTINREKTAYVNRQLEEMGADTDLWRTIKILDGRGSVMAPLLWLIYCNDLDEDINTNTTRSLYADDTALLATGRSLQACADQLQPDLDQVARWLDKWKVEASPSKCVFTTFSLHAKEVNGKVVPTLTFKGDQLAHEKNPTFLGLTLDSQLTFTNHIEEVKKRMAQRRCCLTALAGRSYGSDQATLRAAYIAYIRSVADYGAALYSTHAAPFVRARLEAEQHKCARVITGCIRLTNSDTLITEAGLPPLAMRAREIAAMEQERLARLPPGDPARALIERHVRPRLKHRAHEAWQRARTEARGRGEPPPNPPSEDTALPFKPCFRRVSQWMAKEAGLADLPREPLALVPEQPPWTNPADAVTFRLSLPRATRRDDPPAVRKAAALEAIAMVNPDCTIWSDGSAKSGTRDGGGGALIQLHRENREVETLLRTGYCPLARATLHRLELTPDPLCRECGAEDTVRHLPTECPAFATTRRRLWGGPLPSLDEVLSGPAGKIVDYIRRVGRSEPPLDQPPSDAPAGAST